MTIAVHTRNQVGEMQSAVAGSNIRGPLLNKVTIGNMLREYAETLPQGCATCAGDGVCPTCKGTGSTGSNEEWCTGCTPACGLNTVGANVLETCAITICGKKHWPKKEPDECRCGCTTRDRYFCSSNVLGGTACGKPHRSPRSA